MPPPGGGVWALTDEGSQIMRAALVPESFPAGVDGMQARWRKPPDTAWTTPASVATPYWSAVVPDGTIECQIRYWYRGAPCSGWSLSKTVVIAP